MQQKTEMASVEQPPLSDLHRPLSATQQEGGGSSGARRARGGEAVGPATQVGLAVLVVVFGCGNNISRQVATKPLNRYTYVLTLATAVAYVPLYGAILAGLARSGSVPRHQLDFVWRPDARGFRYILLFALAALGDTLGDVISMICSPYVSGPINSLTSNCVPVFIAILAFCVLQQTYSLLQVLSLMGVITGVVLGVLPSFKDTADDHSNVSRPFFVTVLCGSCIFNAISFIVKELLFKRYSGWLERQGIDSTGQSLNVFVVCFHASLFQLPFTLLTVPMNVLLGQTHHGEGVLEYLGEAFACVFNSSPESCGPDAVHAESVDVCMIVYVVFNVLWNVSILVSVKCSGALATFVSLKAIFPISTILFACVDWPLLRRTELDGLVWLSLCLILPCIGLYHRASRWQGQRAAAQPPSAACCWPLRAA
ncbi:unnamed protein product [Prorocentrum cordatum]|uniref:EamA domain-containing protein n=1 Tax=Prorocentrum cordatum TaxID=2364126 RepID=A0ABN9RZ41_9DINO|nr:unnamed protein product [Polarella glacialis]